MTQHTEFLGVIKTLITDPEQAKNFDITNFFEKNDEVIKQNVSHFNFYPNLSFKNLVGS